MATHSEEEVSSTGRVGVAIEEEHAKQTQSETSTVEAAGPAA